MSGELELARLAVSACSAGRDIAKSSWPVSGWVFGAPVVHLPFDDV